MLSKVVGKTAHLACLLSYLRRLGGQEQPAPGHCWTAQLPALKCTSKLKVDFQHRRIPHASVPVGHLARQQATSVWWVQRAVQPPQGGLLSAAPGERWKV